jgi:molybdopterin synthase sulfurtransferase
VVEVGRAADPGPQLDFHLPNARWLDTDHIEADTDMTPRNWWRLVPDRELFRVFGSLGLAADTTVVLYGKGGMVARVAWAMLVAGVRDVRILDGGIGAWQRWGGHVERSLAVPLQRAFVSSVRGELRLDRDQVRSRLADPSFLLADVRAYEEFSGQSSGYGYIEAVGRIPGAIWARGGPSANWPIDYIAPDRDTFRPVAEVARMWRAAGIAPRGEVCFYCGTGWRASVAFLYAHWMGWDRVSLYDGGWFDWSCRPREGVDVVAGFERRAPTARSRSRPPRLSHRPSIDDRRPIP